MRHAGPVAEPQRETSGYCDVQEWGGAEETATGKDRAAGKHGDGLRGLRETTRGGTKFQVPGGNNDGGGRRLANWPAVAGNLGKARKSWGRLERILIREGADKRISGKFFKAVVQQVLLFGAETWVLTPRIERVLDSFMHGAARRITGR